MSPKPGGERPSTSGDRVYGIEPLPAPERIQPDRKMQGRIVEALAYSHPPLLLRKPLESELADKRREIVLQKIARGDIAGKQISELLRAVKAPAQDRTERKKIWAEIEDDPRLKVLLSVAIYGRSGKEENLGPRDLGKLMKKHSEPAACEHAMRDIRRRLRHEQALNTYEQKMYEAAQQDLMRKVYGPMQAVYEQVQLMQREAHRRYPNLKSPS